MASLSQPEDIASACLYLASDDANFITGVVLEVDGGRTIRPPGGPAMAKGRGPPQRSREGLGACRKPGFSCLIFRPMLRCRSVRPRILS
ncbi:SDR family oxidoreductase [Azospirillum sp. HJ39]|uniref:SDR family oxidoreductase n=1 Tax=Azospirillum sp. HJ39 TaxID=3159496 RepID=UPI003556BF79